MGFNLAGKKRSSKAFLLPQENIKRMRGKEGIRCIKGFRILKRQKFPCDNKKETIQESFAQAVRTSDLKKKACSWEWHRLCHFAQVVSYHTSCADLSSTNNLRLGFTQVVQILVLIKSCGLEIAQAVSFYTGCADFSPTKEFKDGDGTGCGDSNRLCQNPSIKTNL